MPTPTNPGTVWLITFQYTSSGQTLLNTFQYVQTVGTTPDYVAFSAAVHGQIVALGGFKDKVKDVISNTVQLQRIVYQPIRPTRYQAVGYVVGENGTMPGDSAPQNVTQSIERRGVTANRGSVGRIQLPQPAASAVVLGLLTAGQIANLNLVGGAMLNQIAPPLTGVVLTPYLVSKDPARTIVPITSTIVQVTSRVQRRRTVGLGK